MREKRVWVVSEVFHPDDTSTAHIMSAIAEYLGNSANVHVLCGPAGYGKIISEKPEVKNVTIHRLKAFNFSKDNIFGRFLRLLFISLGMFFFGLWKVRKEDRLLLVTNPAFSIPLFAWLRILKRFKFIILVHDVFPENLIPARIISSKNNFIYRVLKKIYDLSYRQADKLIVLGRDMRSVMEVKKADTDKIVIIENWSDLNAVGKTDYETNEIIEMHQLQNKIVFLFAGNLGRVQGLERFFNIISSVTNELIHFLFVGDGAILQELKAIKEDKELNNVTFLGTFPRSQQNNFLNASHFGVVTLEEEVFGLGVPSKSYNILAASKPILFIGNQNSEIALMIKEEKCGLSFSIEERLKLVTFFENLTFQHLPFYSEMGNLGRRLAEKNYAKDSILSKFKNELIDAD